MKLPPEVIEKLNKPLPKEAIKQHPTKTYLSTIKAIYVVERLNDCFGVGGWLIANEVVTREAKWVVVKSTLTIPEFNITVPDIFGGNDNPDLGDAYKGACTDALTKIGSYLGIGMDVYKGLGDQPIQPKKEVAKQVLTPEHENWEKVIAYLKGSGTMTDILKKYTITKEVSELLINKTLE